MVSHSGRAFPRRRSTAPAGRLLLFFTLMALGATACSGDDDAPVRDLYEGDGERYRATLHITEYGIPHVFADDLASAMFGVGYAFAGDHACTLVEMILRVRGEAAQHFGPGPGRLHVDQDFAMRHLRLYQDAPALLAGQPREILAAITGYAAGFNHRLSATPEEIPSLCRGAAWLRPITPAELMAYYRFLALTGSARQILDYIGNATPPPPPTALTTVDRTPRGHIRDLATPPLASNGYALGRQRTASGGGMVLANPHFPWAGELRLWELHLQVPGLTNLYGATLLGVPTVLIGFNEHIAWTHTFSMIPRFTLYRLRLDPEDPTRYRYGDTLRDMEAETYEVVVRAADGSEARETRTLYRSHYGPLLNIDPIGWSTSQALTFRDANLNNDRLIRQFLGMGLARDMDAFVDVHLNAVQGIPWVHTMAASRDGEVFYADAGATPFVDDAALARWQGRFDARDPLTRLIWGAAGLKLLDGADPSDAWRVEADAPEPGLVPMRLAPHMRRHDYVMNANDSARVPHHSAHLNNHPLIYEVAPTPLGMRSRRSLSLLAAPATSTGTFTIEDLKTLLYDAPGYAAELWLDEILEQCDATPVIQVQGRDVDLRPACTVLEAWDRRYHTTSRGAALFRQVLFSEGMRYTRYAEGRVTTLPFDPDAPMDTPRGLLAGSAEDPGPGLRGVAHALQVFQSRGWPLDIPLGDLQFSDRDGERRPVNGAFDYEGGVHSVWYGREALSRVDDDGQRYTFTGDPRLTDDGYPITYGSSFLMVMGYEQGRARGYALLTYGQSGDPESPHRSDQFPLMQARELRPIRFTQEEVLASPALRTVELDVSRTP